MLRCKVIDKNMQLAYGEVIHLEPEVARVMVKSGKVEIVPTDENRGVLAKYKVVEYIYRGDYANNKGLKVAWIQDYNKDGGAELSNFVVTKIGDMLGYDIVGVTPEKFNMKVLEGADIVILNNFFNFLEADLQKILKFVYESGKPVVKYEHDHREINLRIDQAKRLFAATAMNVFISPLQLRNHTAALGEIKSIALPLAFDVELFVNKKEKREEKSVLVPSFSKCTENTIKYIIEHPDEKFYIVGNADIPGKSVKCLPRIAGDEMPRYYNQYETVLHVPQKIGGGERVIFEAVLCGCKVVTNENSAHLSWSEKFDWKNETTLREQLMRAPFAFWREMAKLCQPKI